MTRIIRDENHFELNIVVHSWHDAATHRKRIKSNYANGYMIAKYSLSQIKINQF